MKMWKNGWGITATSLWIIIMVVGSFIGCMSSPVEPLPDPPETPEGRISNPYSAIDWATAEEHHGNFHTHTTYSDGNLDPHTVIDRYLDLGYTILALTDHDSAVDNVRSETLWSWTDFNDIYHEIKDEIPRWYPDQTWEQRSNQEWQNRDPQELGMVAIEGVEVSRTHHINSFFSDYHDGTTSEQQALTEIGLRNGLAIFCHPARTSGNENKPIDWYVQHYLNHDHLIGQEVYTTTRYGDSHFLFWDPVLYQLMPDRPVWGFANDDMHVPSTQLGWNRNVFMLSELTKENVRSAMESGEFFFYRPATQARVPNIHVRNIEVDATSITIDVDGPVEEIQWITYDVFEEERAIIHYGESIDLENIPDYATYVRAVIIEQGHAGRLYTQPFGIQRELPQFSFTVNLTSDGVGLAGAEIRNSNHELLGITDDNGDAELEDIPMFTELRIGNFRSGNFRYIIESDPVLVVDDATIYFTAEAIASVILVQDDFSEVVGNRPANWTWNNSGAPAGTTFGVDSNVSFVGDNSVFIDVPGNPLSDSFPRFERNFNLSALDADVGDTIRLSVQIKTDDVRARNADWGGVKVFMRFFDASGSRIQIEGDQDRDFDAITGTNDWTEWDVEYTIPEGTHRMWVRLYYALTAGKAWFDDFIVEKILD